MANKTIRFQPECIASDGTSFYAKFESEDKIWLVKSNASPSTLRDLSWSLLSTVPRAERCDINPYRSSCSISSQGIFTVLGSDSNATCGIQFSPANGGKWNGISAPNISLRDDLPGIMFWIEKDRAPLLMRVHRRYTETGSELRVSLFVSKAGAFMEQSVRVVPSNEYNPSLAFGGDRLYVTSTKRETPNEIQVDILSMKNGTFPSDPASVKRLSNIAPSCDETITTFVAGDTYHLICMNRGTYRKYLVTSDGKTTKPPVEVKSWSYLNVNTNRQTPFLPMGQAGMSPTWAFSGGERLLSLSLTGDRMGALEYAYYASNLTVPDNSNGIPASRAVHVATDIFTTVFIALMMSVFLMMRH